MPSLETSQNLNKVFAILARGMTGTGKTIASCGKAFRPVFLFDLDQRVTSVANYYKKLDGHCKDIDYQSFAMGTHFKELDSKMDELIARPMYKTVVVASLTSYIHIVLAHVLKFKSGKGEGKRIADINVNSIEDYNVEDAAIIFELLGFLKELQRQGTNVILEAHLTPIEYRDLQGNSTTKLDTLTKGKKGPASIPGYFDEVYYFSKKHEGIVVGTGTVKYEMSPKGDSTVDAKTSRGIQPIEWTDKDFSELLMGQVK